MFKLKVMPFGVANAPGLLQELMNKILYILTRRPLVQELISRGAEMEAHIDDPSLGTNDAFPWGAWPRDAAVTRTSEQAGKALHSQGHHYARVM